MRGSARSFHVDERHTAGEVRSVGPAPCRTRPSAATARSASVRVLALDFGEPIAFQHGPAMPAWRKISAGWQPPQTPPPYRVSRFDEVARGQDDDEEDDGAQPAASPPPPPPPDFVTIQVPVGSGGAPPPAAGAAPAAASPAAPAPGDGSSGDEDGGLSQASSAADADLRRDLRALAGGPPSAPAAPVRTAAQGAGSIPAAVRATSAHDVFDRIEMGLARTFDAGTFDLGARLDQLDARLAREERAAAAAGIPSEAKGAAAPDTEEGRSVAAAEEECEPPPAVAHEEALEDVRAVREAATPPPEPADLSLTVPLVAADDRVPAHAAAAAMLVAWREGTTAGADAIASGAGPWARYGALLREEGPRFFSGFGLELVQHRHASVEELRHLLQTFGPLWTATDPPGAHARVVTGLVGDGTPAGTRVRIADPWDEGRDAYAAPNHGSTYEVPFSRFAAERLLIAHLPRPPDGRGEARNRKEEGP